MIIHNLSIKSQNFLTIAIYFIVSAWYLKLYYYMPFSINMYGLYDDALFVRQALEISRGHWLGTFSHFTLMKGPGYALFLVMAHYSKLPLYLFTGIFHVFSIGFIAYVLYEITNSKILATFLILTLIWCPLIFSNGNIHRDQIYADQFLLGFSLLLYATIVAKNKISLLMSGLLSGVIFGWFWLTREEGIWIIPGLAIVTVLFLIKTWHDKERRITLVKSFIIIAFAFVFTQIGYQSLNWYYYGKFQGVDVKDSNFKTALAAVQSVRVEEPISHVPVSNKALAQLYQVSPTFNQLQDYFLTAGNRWRGVHCDFYPWTCQEYTGGVFIWAFREAVAMLGQYRSPAQAADFYGKIAQEVTSACNDGRLSCRRGLIDLMPTISKRDFQTIPDALKTLLNVIFLKFNVDTSLYPRSNFVAPFEIGAGILDFLHTWDRFTLVKPSVIIYGEYKFLGSELNVPHLKIVNSFGEEIKFSIAVLDTNHFIINTVCDSHCSIYFSSDYREYFQSILYELPGKNLNFKKIAVSFSKIENGHQNEILDNYDQNSATTFEYRKSISKIYKSIFSYFICIALLVFLISLWLSIKNSNYSISLIISGVLWILTFTRITILFLVHISSFPALNEYFMPNYSIIIFASVMSIFVFLNENLFKQKMPNDAT